MEFFGLRWNRKPTGLADGFTAESIGRAKSFRQKLLTLNPHLVLIVEIRYRDARKSYLPEGHKWWLRDKEGQVVPEWDEGGSFCLDFHNREFRSHVAGQAKAAVDSGAVELTVEHEGTTYKLVHGDLYRVASSDRLVFVEKIYDKDFRKTNLDWTTR